MNILSSGLLSMTLNLTDNWTKFKKKTFVYILALGYKFAVDPRE